MKRNTEDMPKVTLVYQGGIANVFTVDCFNLASFGRNAKRVYQGDFRSAEIYCLGRYDAGDMIGVAGCNMAGDISESQWTDNLDDLPFSDQFHFDKRFITA